MLKLVLYFISLPLVIWSMESVNINQMFKKNRPYQARVLYVILVFSLTYLFASCLYDFCDVINF